MGLEVRRLGELKRLTEQDIENLKFSGGEGSWTTHIYIENSQLSPLFHLVPNIKKEIFNKEFYGFPINRLVYKRKKNVRAFSKPNHVKMSINHELIDDIDVVTTTFASFDEPNNPFIVESYYNPYFEDEEDGELNFLETIKVLSESSVFFFAGYSIQDTQSYSFEGLTLLEVTPEFQDRAREIFQQLELNKSKRQTKDEFLKAKMKYQSMVKLDHRTIEWLGDIRPLLSVKEFD